MKKVKIPKPCSEKWENMTPVGKDKFCKICQKKVYDIDSRTFEEINEIKLREDKFCGKLSSIVRTTAFVITLTITSCHSTNHTLLNTDQQTKNPEQTITGKIKWYSKTNLVPKELYFITKDNIYRGKINSDNSFEFKIPQKAISKKNIIRVAFEKTEFNKTYEDYENITFLKEQLSNEISIIADSDTVTIGAVVITVPQPPDFYFIDGKSVTQRKFKKTKNEILIL